MSVNNKLQLILVQVDHSSGGLLCGCEEEDGENGHLKLGADSYESTAHRLDQAMPAELHVQDVVVLVRLKQERARDIFQWK